MKMRALLATVIAVLFTWVGYEIVLSDSIDMFKSEKGSIRIAGGTAHIPVMKEAAKQIMTINPSIQISIAGGGSGVGIKQVGEGLIDIGNTGREPTGLTKKFIDYLFTPEGQKIVQQNGFITVK